MPSGSSFSGQLILHIERRLPAPPAEVFRMHSEPGLFAQWFGPKGFSVPTAELDVRVGGRYRVAMQPPEGEPFSLSGEFREVEPPVRLVYTFRWEPPDPDDRDTVVTLTLRAFGTLTDLTVDQGAFATEARRSLHERGWSETLDRLEQLLST